MRLNTYAPRESNPAHTHTYKYSYYYYDDNNYSRGTKKPILMCISTLPRGVNNYQKAVMEAFQLLATYRYAHKHRPLVFDQELCKTMVIKYHLSCSDCKLDCEMHDLEVNQ